MDLTEDCNAQIGNEVVLEVQQNLIEILPT